MEEAETPWFDDYADGADELEIDEYDITATPNDFNVLTLFNFVESGAVRIPGFQRNFVWDQARSSKLIESLILGIPVPQLFLYEQARNRFLVIDGQQRLMSIYYFLKMRFPRKERRVALRAIFDEHGRIPDDVLHDDHYFDDFKLKLTSSHPGSGNRFHGANYARLGEYKTQLDLRPIRNIIVKQNSPAGDDSSIYEVFNRLNTGGINLRPQEIRTSMYHSGFYEMLYRANQNGRWRDLLGSPEPDLHMKDIEILLRGYAMLMDSAQYAPSMVRFLNYFSKKCESLGSEENRYLEDLFNSFIEASSELPEDSFLNQRNNRFNIALFEAVFTATCETASKERRLLEGKVSAQQVAALEADPNFVSAAMEGTTHTSNVEARLNLARNKIKAL